MIFSTLTAISPVDGRYRNKAENLAAYFSEYALIKYRVQVEIEYFITLSEFLPQLRALATGENKEALRKIYREFSVEDATRIKEIESVTNHDVKAVEYFIKEKFDLLSLQEYKEFIHFGLTSQDINNTSVPLSIKDALNEVYFPGLQEVIDMLKKYAEDWADVPMLAKTHGQPASPTRLGKEVMVFVYRLEQQVKLLKVTPVSAKFGGATGNFNAHHVAFPEYDWKAFGNKFVNEVFGSSAMPHKVNPIDFENAEGNLGMANAILTHLATKLPISRLQRDLTDSTVLRNVGVPMAHVEIAFKSLTKGLGKLLLNEKALYRDLDNCWAVVAEGIQTILRREGYPKPYEALKALTRTNEGITAESISNFIDTLQVSDAVKAELKAITPHNYTGI